jgi:hypothetical protein
MNIYDDDEKDDFFENSEIPEKREEPKKPVYTPDDPRYWEEPEDEFEHLRPAPGKHWKLWIWIAAAGIAAGMLWAGYLRVFQPYAEHSTQYGYVENIEKRGDLFKTYEGVLLPYKNLMDTTRVYEGDFVFSTSNPGIAAKLKEVQYANRPVRVIYSVYHTAMPWRGDTRIMITRVDSVNERDILPPDRQPETLSKNN